MSAIFRRAAGRGAAALLLVSTTAVQAQNDAEAASPPQEAGGSGAEAADRRVYSPEQFERYAPRSALDMLNQVPGFRIDQGDRSSRGLGAASANVLINGRRFSGKSNDVVTELGRIPAANVERIEIVDGATLDIAGLSGQVANIVTLNQALNGTFAWRPRYWAEQGTILLTNGEISVSGSAKGTDYTFSFRNQSFRDDNDGPEIVIAPDGTIRDRRDETLRVHGEQPRLSASIHRDRADGSILNLNLAAGLFHLDVGEDSLRTGPGEPDRFRDFAESRREWNYEIGGDYEFALGSGRMKLIGLRRFNHIPFGQRVVTSFADRRPDQGDRFSQVADQGEMILRNEYRWRSGTTDWQISGEGALNVLDLENSLLVLDADGVFVPVPFPNSAAKVEERRAEGTVTYRRPLSSAITLQSSLGGEYSRLEQSGANGLTRSFVRPKGFASLALKASERLRLNARIERKVGQLDFFDFVASTNLSGGTANSGNAELVPPQSWELEIEGTREFGRWGTATLRGYGRLISDIVDIIPVGETGQSPGNLDTATIYGMQWTSTLNFDPLGLRGAKLDLDLRLQHTSLEDPLTALDRFISDNMRHHLQATFRHDVPSTDWAYGFEFFDYHAAPTFRLDQRTLFTDFPATSSLFVEHKDVRGLTVRLTAENPFGKIERFERLIFDGRRTGPLLLTESRERFPGPVVMLTITGTL